MPIERIRIGLRWVLAFSMIVVGVLHFTSVDVFLAMMPPWVPWHRAMVYLSGVFEILGGLGLLVARTRRLAGWGLIVLFVAVFPANLYMALENVPFDGQPVPPAVLWGRLPFQIVFIVWAWWVSREGDSSHAPTESSPS